jgi:type VI secretion system secreted protein VgrG
MSTRTFILKTPLDDDLLRLVHLTGHEALSEVSEFHLDILSPSADVDPHSLLGATMRVEVTTQSGGTRYINGLVTMFSYIGPEGSASRLYRYKARLNSWLYLAQKTADCRIYQQLTVPQIISEALADFSLPFEFKLTGQYAINEYIVQWNETALQFIMRLAESVGIYWYTRYNADGHSIIFCDGLHPTLPEYDKIPFLIPGLRNLAQEEYITEWEVRHEVHSGRYATRSYNYKHPSANLERQETVSKQHAHDALEIYEWTGTYTDRDEGGNLVTVRREQQQLGYETITAKSNVRGIAPGFSFTMKNNPREKSNIDYLIVSADYTFHESPDTTKADGEVTSWSIDFTVRSTKNRYYPPRVTPKPRVGLQTAVVSGPAGEEIWTNSYGEVKLTFPWDRRAQDNENDTKWIPVASGWAGSTNGEKMLPRIGDSVVVDHIDGDPDRPVVTSRVHDQWHMPHSFSNTGHLPTNRALAGIKSKELGGERYNQLLFDDTAGEIRAQLESEHAKSQLNLGYLTQPRDGSATPRGEGFELRTDAWGTLRADKGLLLTTDGRPTGIGGSLSRDELIKTLQEALTLAKSLGEFAEQNQANASDPKPQETLSKAVNDWGHGSNAEKGGNGGHPVLAVSSPAGIALGTPKSTTIATGEHLDMVSEKNQHLTAGQKMNLHAGQGISQFAQNGGIKSIANHGKHITQSQDDDIQISADKSVLITATTDHVMVAADKHVTLTSGGGYIKISGGNIEIHCPGSVSIKAGNYSLTGPTSMSAELPSFGKGDTGKKFKLQYGMSTTPVPDQKYKITLDDGQVIQGVTDQAGQTSLAAKDQMRMAAVEFLKKDA